MPSRTTPKGPGNPVILLQNLSSQNRTEPYEAAAHRPRETTPPVEGRPCRQNVDSASHPLIRQPQCKSGSDRLLPSASQFVCDRRISFLALSTSRIEAI